MVTEGDPTTVLEQQLLDMWRTALGNNDFAPTDSFFASGGDSMLAIRLLATMRQELDLPRLSIRAVFQHPTVREFAALAAELTAQRSAGV